MRSVEKDLVNAREAESLNCVPEKRLKRGKKKKMEINVDEFIKWKKIIC